jgi:PAS domain S-box-containing protein
MDFVGPYDKQAAKQHPPTLLTPLLAGWEFRPNLVLPTGAEGLMALAKVRNWQLTPALRQKLFNNKLAIIVTDRNQLIQYVNTHFEQMSGYSYHEMIGQRPNLLQGVGTSAEVRQRIRQAIAQQQSVDEWLLNYRKDQTEYGCHIRIWPILNHRQELVNFVALEQEVAPDVVSV